MSPVQLSFRSHENNMRYKYVFYKPEMTPNVKHRMTVLEANWLTANPIADVIPPSIANRRQLYLFINTPANGPELCHLKEINCF